VYCRDIVVLVVLFWCFWCVKDYNVASVYWNIVNQLTFVFLFAKTRSIKRMWHQLTERMTEVFIATRLTEQVQPASTVHIKQSSVNTTKWRYTLLRVNSHGDFLTLTTDFFISANAVIRFCFTAGGRTLVFFDNGCFVTGRFPFSSSAVLHTSLVTLLLLKFCLLLPASIVMTLCVCGRQSHNDHIHLPTHNTIHTCISHLNKYNGQFWNLLLWQNTNKNQYLPLYLLT